MCIRDRFIAVSAFATLFSSCLTAHDAIARVSLDIIDLLLPKKHLHGKKGFFALAIGLLAVVNFTVVTAFSANMGQLVSLATFVSFVVAPIIGYMNLKNVMSAELPEHQRPKKGLQWLTYAGILFLSFFSIYYFWMIIF